MPCETVIGSLREPSDFAGLPVVTDDGVRLEPPAWAKRLHAAQAGYLFLDELSTSPPAVQAAMLGVALERRVGDLLLPRAVQVVAAANPPERAADGWDLTPAAGQSLPAHRVHARSRRLDRRHDRRFLAARQRTRGQPNRERTAIARANVAAFIRCRPALLDACPTNPTASGRAWPSRRTWTMTADVLALLADDDADAAYLAACGLVGEGAAVEYLTWRREADLPDPARGGGRSDQRRLALARPVAGVGHPGRRGRLQHRQGHRRSLARRLGTAGRRRRDGQGRCRRRLRPHAAHGQAAERTPAARGARLHRRADRCRPDERRVSVSVRALNADEARLLTAARLVAVEHAPYLAHALFTVRPVAAEGLGTFAVDRGWRLYVDPATLAGWGPALAGGVLVHEIGHLVRAHAERADALGADYDHERWNLGDGLRDQRRPARGRHAPAGWRRHAGHARTGRGRHRRGVLRRAVPADSVGTSRRR